MHGAPAQQPTQQPTQQVIHTHAHTRAESSMPCKDKENMRVHAVDIKSLHTAVQLPTFCDAFVKRKTKAMQRLLEHLNFNTKM